MRPRGGRSDDRDPVGVRRSVDIRANAAGMKARDAAFALLRDVDRLPPVEQLHVVDAVADLLDEVHRWRDALASERVDKDRQVRAAMARSASCDAHGEEIRGLAAQVDAVDQARDRSETARLVVLGWYQTCVDFARIARANQRLERPLPASDAILSWMERQLPKVHAAHQRAWSRPIHTERNAAER